MPYNVLKIKLIGHNFDQFVKESSIEFEDLSEEDKNERIQGCNPKWAYFYNQFASAVRTQNKSGKLCNNLKIWVLDWSEHFIDQYSSNKKWGTTTTFHPCGCNGGLYVDIYYNKRARYEVSWIYN